MKKRSILTAIVAGILSIGLIGCGGSNSSNGDDKVIKVGVSPVPHEEIMEVAKPLLEAKGYKVEIVEFTDYVLPNTSLENGELDANYFQHIAYLNSFNADNGTHLTYTAEIHLEPMGAFSKKYKSVDEVKEGAVVALPDDPSNEARALRVLAAAGLIEVKDKNIESIKERRNILAVKEGNENTQKIKDLTEALTSKEVRDFINEKYKGAVVPVF